MVAALTSVAGVATAWTVGAYEFPLRRTLSWALVLPLAVPSYLAAYAFGEFFHFSGPVQGAVRAIFGFETVRDYWFPDIRTTPGCAFVLASVLYPYVYLTTRIVFLMQGRNIADVARTLGARPAKVFLLVLLPVARPGHRRRRGAGDDGDRQRHRRRRVSRRPHADLRRLHDMAEPGQPRGRARRSHC